MQDNAVSKSVTLVGNSSVQNTVSSLMVKCLPIKLSVVVMMLSTLSSVKLEPVNTSQDVYSSISNQLLLMKSELVHTDNYSIQNNLSLVKKTPLTISLEDIIPSVKKSLIYVSIESENQLTNVLDYKVSLFSMLSVVEQDQDQDPSYQKDFQSITVKNLNQVSPFIHPHKSQLPLLNHITQSFQLTPSQNTLMLLLCSITKLSMISVEELQILKDQLTPILTDSSLRLSPL